MDIVTPPSGNSQEKKSNGLSFEKQIKLKGFHPAHNPDRDYSTAKKPIKGKGWTDINGDREKWEAEGGWIGGIIPPGRVDCDIDDKATGNFLYDSLKKAGAAFYKMDVNRRAIMTHYGM